MPRINMKQTFRARQNYKHAMPTVLWLWSTRGIHVGIETSFPIYNETSKILRLPY